MVVSRAILTLLVIVVVQLGLLALVHSEFLLAYLLTLYHFPSSLGTWWSILRPFMAFLAVPVAATAIAAAVYLHRAKSTGWRRHLILNALIFTTFFATAEIFKDVLVLAKAGSTPHDCLQIRSFMGSLHRHAEYSPAHAMLIRGNVQYRWSYTELTFVEREYPNPAYTCADPFFRF
jgi:hypothetical protein